ncbi:hypothetical protein ACTFIY_009161 [Dictyostelium cf. discoideum]
MQSFIKLFLFIFLLFNFKKSIAVPQKPLPADQTNVALSILQSLYNIDPTTFEDICGYNDCFTCELSSSSNLYYVYSINMNNSLNNFVVTQDLSVFEKLDTLIIGEKVQLPTSFYNSSLSSLNKISKLTTIPRVICFISNLYSAEFDKISVPLSSVWFESSLFFLRIGKPLIGFKYPIVTKINYNLRGVVLSLSHIDNNIPSNLTNTFPNLSVITFEIYNEISEIGYKNYSIQSINQNFKAITTVVFNFFNLGNSETIRKFPLIQSYIYNFELSVLDITDIGFTLDPSVGYLDFSNMSKSGLILTIDGACDLVDECKVTSCIVMPKVDPNKYSRNSITIENCITPSLTPLTTTSSSSTTTSSTNTTSSASTSSSTSTTSSSTSTTSQTPSSASSNFVTLLSFYICCLVILF